jgi:SAM-dependent methyltransferase
MSESSAVNFYEDYWAHRTQRGDHTAANRVKLRHEQAAEFIRRELPMKGTALIDLGCGDGIMGQLLSGDGYRITGADISPRALDIAKPHYAAVRQLDMDRDATPPEWRGAFDGVICLEVLEHLEKPGRNIERAFELLKPGGVAAFSYPNIFSWKNRWMFVRGRWPHGYCTYDPREHLQVFELGPFKRMVSDAGFEVMGTAITPDLPKFRPLRKLMFRARGLLNAVGPTFWAMQINVFGTKRG